MGIIQSYLVRTIGWNGGVVDENTGLTKKEKFLVHDTWKSITKKSSDTGVAILLSFFEKFPKYQDEFVSFRGVPLNELSESKKFQAHCYSIVSAVTSAIDSLDDYDLMKQLLIAVGERHARRGQSYQAFHDLKTVILEVLKTALASKYTPEVAHAWNKTLDLLFAQIFEGLRPKNS